MMRFHTRITYLGIFLLTKPGPGFAWSSPLHRLGVPPGQQPHRAMVMLVAGAVPEF